jgi:ribosomal-protein-alanine N-acetyltransferase
MVKDEFKELIIRSMQANDLKEVLVIEEESFSSPWTYNMFYYELTQNRYARYFVLEKDKEIIGYLGLWHKGSSFHITNIAIIKKSRRKGYGEKLLKFVEKIAITYKIKKISLEVRKSNYIAQNMYEKYGYKVIKVWKNYYREEKEDALIMEKKLS